MKTKTYKSLHPNKSGEYVVQIDVLNTQIHIVSETIKERNSLFSLIQKVLKIDQYQKTNHVTYWTIQHSYPNHNINKWYFSNYDNIASAAQSLSIPKDQGRFGWVYGTNYGATSLKQAKIGLERVIDANKKDPKSGNPIFRIVKVTHFFDVVEPLN